MLPKWPRSVAVWMFSCFGGSGGELSRAERASFEKSVEQKISHLMLKALGWGMLGLQAAPLSLEFGI